MEDMLLTKAHNYDQRFEMDVITFFLGIAESKPTQDQLEKLGCNNVEIDIVVRYL